MIGSSPVGLWTGPRRSGRAARRGGPLARHCARPWPGGVARAVRPRAGMRWPRRGVGCGGPERCQGGAWCGLGLGGCPWGSTHERIVPTSRDCSDGAGRLPYTRTTGSIAPPGTASGRSNRGSISSSNRSNGSNRSTPAFDVASNPRPSGPVGSQDRPLARWHAA